MPVPVCASNSQSSSRASIPRPRSTSLRPAPAFRAQHLVRKAREPAHAVHAGLKAQASVRQGGIGQLHTERILPQPVRPQNAPRRHRPRQTRPRAALRRGPQGDHAASTKVKR